MTYGKDDLAIKENEAKFVKLLRKIVELLEKYSSFNWAGKLRNDLLQFEQLLNTEASDANSQEKIDILVHIASFYGGMGSFNDAPLIIDKGQQEMVVHGEFQTMKGELYKLIGELRYLYDQSKKHIGKENN